FNHIASKWGKLMEVDDYDDTNFHSKSLCILTKVYQNTLESFKIVFRGKVYWMRAKEVPGWTPEFTEEEEEDDVSVEDNHGGIHSDQEINNCNDVSDVDEGSGMSLETESTPMIVLDDECLNTKDLSCSLMGRVKEFTSLSNLKKVLCNEGFDVLKISYLGELWVLIEFESAKVKDLFKENGRANSCKVYWMRAKEVPGWTPEFIEEEEEDDVSVEDNHGGIHSDQEINNCNDESDVEEVPETCFNVTEGQKGNPSEDPFGIYPLLNKDKNIREHKIVEEESSLKHPSGFTPVNEEVTGDDNSFLHTVSGKENSRSVNKMSDSMGSCCLKKPRMPRTGGSILSFMEEVVNVGQTMGYNMDGCVKDITEIIKSQREFEVHR
nr:nucleotide-binding alpha-beta plait domain-containing protein [Tanacetum cinerariifolium]